MYIDRRCSFGCDQKPRWLRKRKKPRRRCSSENKWRPASLSSALRPLPCSLKAPTTMCAPTFLDHAQASNNRHSKVMLMCTFAAVLQDFWGVQRGHPGPAREDQESDASIPGEPPPAPPAATPAAAQRSHTLPDLDIQHASQQDPSKPSDHQPLNALGALWGGAQGVRSSTFNGTLTAGP